MAERSSINQVVQIGVETTPGTYAAPTRRLQSFSIEPSPMLETDVFGPTGSKYKTSVAPTKEWVEASLEGRASFSELTYILASALSKSEPVVDVDAADSPGLKRWVFSSSTSEDDDPATFSIQHGSGVRADAFVYGLVTELGFSFSRDVVEVSGSMIGRALQDDVVLVSSGIEADEPEIVLPTQVTVYLDDDHTNLGTTPFRRLTRGDWNLGSRFNPLWVVDASQNSFVTHLESEPDLTASIMVEADEAGMELLSMAREGETRFLRFEAIGREIGTGNFLRLCIDTAVKISDTGGFSDEDGMYAIEWSFTGVYDTGWGKAMEITLDNLVDDPTYLLSQDPTP